MFDENPVEPVLSKKLPTNELRIDMDRLTEEAANYAAQSGIQSTYPQIRLEHITETNKQNAPTQITNHRKGVLRFG